MKEEKEDKYLLGKLLLLWLALIILGVLMLFGGVWICENSSSFFGVFFGVLVSCGGILLLGGMVGWYDITDIFKKE